MKNCFDFLQLLSEFKVIISSPYMPNRKGRILSVARQCHQDLT